MNWHLSFLLLLFLTSPLSSRSPLRTPDPLCPLLTVQWKSLPNKKTYKIRDSHLEYTPLFKTYQHDYFNQNLLPQNAITYRNQPQKSINGAKLSTMIEGLLQEVYNGKKTYKDFIILKNRDFNLKQQAGLLVVKCKHYPFVVKLFMETPESFVCPHTKGFEPYCFFIIGGGINRHLLGFTRIKNRNIIDYRIKKNQYWNQYVDTPRKWFWLPKNPRYLSLNGYNIGNEKQATCDIPAIYALVTDEIKMERNFSIFSQADRHMAIDLSNFCLCRLDPHITNFIIEKDTDKILIIDTEHFPSMAGFKKRPRINTYTSWYFHLFFKFIKDKFCRSKKTRKAIQKANLKPFFMP